MPCSQVDFTVHEQGTPSVEIFLAVWPQGSVLFVVGSAKQMSNIFCLLYMFIRSACRTPKCKTSQANMVGRCTPKNPGIPSRPPSDPIPSENSNGVSDVPGPCLKKMPVRAELLLVDLQRLRGLLANHILLSIFLVSSVS